MTDTQALSQVSLYLRGDALNPAHVSSVLGIVPSASQEKGERRVTSTQREFLTEIGLWVLTAVSNSTNPRSLDDLIEEITSQFGRHSPKLAEIEGVEEVYVDVFSAVDADADGEGTYEMGLCRESLSALTHLGAPLRFTIAVVRK